MTISPASVSLVTVCCSLLCIAVGCSRPDATPIAGSRHALVSMSSTKDATPAPRASSAATSSSPPTTAPPTGREKNAPRPGASRTSRTPQPGARSASYAPPATGHESESSPRSAGATYIVECADQNLVTEPASLTLTCGDANEALSGLTWVAWGTARASASGMYVVNSCDPSCADGSPLSAPVHLTADRPTRHGDQQFYSRIIVTFDFTPPPGTDAVMTYPLPH